MKNYKQILLTYHQYCSLKNRNRRQTLIESNKFRKMQYTKFSEAPIDAGNFLIFTEVIKLIYRVD